MKGLRTIILAAGKGTRIKSETPKVLHSVCGKPLLQYVLDVVFDIGSVKNCVVLGHRSQQVKEALRNDIQVVIQKRLLGTADAVKCAYKYFKNYKGDVLILCGDTPLLHPETLKKLIRKHRKTNAACTFLTAFVQEPIGYGRVLRDSKGMAVAIREENDATEFEKNIIEINVGVYCFKSNILFQLINDIRVNKRKKEFYLTDIIEILTQQGDKNETLEVEEANEGLGINTREDLAKSEAILRQRILKEFMLKGVTIVDPQTAFIHADVKIGQDTVICPFTIIESNVVVGANCIIGPFAHLRPGTKIGNHVQVGNFAEVSRTQLGERTLMKHFSFLGDAQVGSHVNIGAGVVTANFDGKVKNKTRILDNAFIGSDSILVAPVKIGKKAITGAGCVVTKGKIIPDRSVVVGVPGRILKRKVKS